MRWGIGLASSAIYLIPMLLLLYVPVPVVASPRCDQPREPNLEDRLAVEAMVSKKIVAADIDVLINLLAGSNHQHAMVAADKLKDLKLNRKHFARLETIVRASPSWSYGERCLRAARKQDQSVLGKWAWQVLQHHCLRGKTVAKQIKWLLPWLDAARPFGGSASNRAALLLQEIGEPAIPGLRKTLKLGTTDAQLWSVRTLDTIGTVEARRAVERWAMSAVKTSDDALTWIVTAEWLAKSGNTKAFKPIERLLWKNLDGYRSGALIRALMKIDPDRALPVLQKVVDKCPPWERDETTHAYFAAATTLFCTGVKEARKGVDEAAIADDPAIRRKLAESLRCENDLHLPVLRRLANDPDESVSKAAKRYLRMSRRGP